MFHLRHVLNRRSDLMLSPAARCHVIHMAQGMMANSKAPLAAITKFALLVTTSGPNRTTPKYGHHSETCAGTQKHELASLVIR